MSDKSGVYVIRCHNHYKIGKADDLKQRLHDLQVGCPYELSVSAFLPCELSEAFKLEQMLHRKYSGCRARGEWFKLSRADLKEICSFNERGISGLIDVSLKEHTFAEYDKAVLDIIRSIYKINKIAFESIIIECSEQIGISEIDIKETIKRLMQYGEIESPCKGAFQPA